MLQPFAVPAFLHETPCQACQCPVMASRNLTGRRRNDDATQFAIFVTRGLESLMRCVEHWYVSTSPRTQRGLCNLVHRRTLMIERHIAEPWYIPSTNAQMLSAEDAGYWSKVADGMYLSYLCRKKSLHALWWQQRGDMDHEQITVPVSVPNVRLSVQHGAARGG
jgi:hypothetical protein